MTSSKRPAARADALRPAALFRRLEGRRGLVLAVSGGADSTALMVLMARWRARPPVMVVSVDHGLRPGSAEEARIVAKNAERLGLPWRVLRAPERVEAGNLQDWARRVRYRLLAEAAREAGYDAIVTAHHQDDQAETFLLRLARGSGVYGLAAMPEEAAVDGIALLRPLLGLSRETVREVAAESRLPIVEDPSNANPRFDRVRMRAAMPELAAVGLTAKRLAETAGRLGRAAAALDHYAGALLKSDFAVDAFSVVSGDPQALAAAPEEVALRALARMLQAVGGADYTPPLDSVEALLAAILKAGDGGKVRRTLSGVVVTATGRRMTARREWGRSGLADAAAPAGATLVWDRRFRIGVPDLKGRLTVGGLARSERDFKAEATERAALGTLPGLYRNGTLVAVPPAVAAADEGAPLRTLAVECLVGERLGIAAESAAGRA